MRVYLDAMLWAYFFERHPQFGPSAHKLLADIHDQGHTLASSVFVLSELLVFPLRENDAFTAAKYNRYFRSAAIELLPYPIEAVGVYAELRGSLRVRPLDALHLAVAVHAKVDLFLTRDKQLETLTVPGIGRIANPDQAF